MSRLISKAAIVVAAAWVATWWLGSAAGLCFAVQDSAQPRQARQKAAQPADVFKQADREQWASINYAVGRLLERAGNKEQAMKHYQQCMAIRI